MEKLDVAEALTSVDRLIRQVVSKFCASCGLKHWEEDLYQESVLIFVQGYPTYDPARGELTTWTHAAVRRRLLDHLEGGRYGARRCESLPDDLAAPGEESPLSEDADEVIREALSLSRPCVGERNRGKPSKIRKGKLVLFRHLRDLGWTAGRIVESFRELQEVFS